MVAGMLPRERLTKKRVTGQLIQWKGKYGWIRPNEQLDDWGKHNGKIYVGIEDIEGDQPRIKSKVDFFVYKDQSGIGAMHCRLVAGGGGGGKGGGKSGGKNGGKGVAKTQKLTKFVKNTFLKVKKEGGESVLTKKKNKGKQATQDGEEANGEKVPPPPPDQDARERVLKKRITGKLVRWGGTMGWIKPNEPIDHPEANKHKKQIYVHEVDIMPGHELERGLMVTCFVYADADGLGAEQVMVAKNQAAAEAKAPGNVPGKGAGKPRAQAKGVIKTHAKAKKKGNAKPHADGEKTKGGPDLPRERLTELPVSGEVVKAKGKIAWIKPVEPIDHEAAKKNRGEVYVHEKDVITGGPLKAGQIVDFHVYVDSSGIGAEECVGID